MFYCAYFLFSPQNQKYQTNILTLSFTYNQLNQEIIMGLFSLFKKKSEIEVLNEKYQKLLKEAHQLSHSDRKASDMKMMEAEDVLNKIDALEAQKSTS